MKQLSADIVTRLKVYQTLLEQWQSAINLVSPSTIDNAWERHFLDSLQLVSFLPVAGNLYDLGSGAGFPGLVIAIARNELNVTLIEKKKKKCAFLKTVSRETQTPVQILNKRIEDDISLPAPDFVTARALAPLSKLLGFANIWAVQNPGLVAYFLKGEDYQNEINQAVADGWEFNCEAFDSETNETGKILKISSIRRQ